MTTAGSVSQGTVFELAAAERELRALPAYARDGHTARTLVRERDLRIVLVVMRTGGKIAEHRAHETASVQVLSGHIRLRVENQLVHLKPGMLLVIPPDHRHEVDALADSAFVLTLPHEPG